MWARQQPELIAGRDFTQRRITSDHVLIDVDTTGQLSSANAHGQTVNAIVIDDAGKVNVDNFTLNGHLFCSTGSNDCPVVSGATINSTVDVSAMPEPISIALAGSGLLLALLARRQLRRA
jgi:hypothetical protein